MKHVFKKLVVFFTLSVLVGVLALAGTTYPFLNEYGPGIVNWGSNVKYGGTLVMVNPSSGPQTDNFNPFEVTNVIPRVIYEPLFALNQLNGDITNMLGTSYRWEDNNLKLVVTTRSNVEWSDGTPFTAYDVAFTFNYIKTHPSLDTSGFWASDSNLQSVNAVDQNTVVFTFSKPNVPLFDYIAVQAIIPEHIWSKITDPSKYTDENPIGTGPFILKSFSPETIIFVKNPNYWMKGRPYINEIKAEFVETNTTALLYMLSHKADWSFLFAPDPIKNYVDRDPNVNKIWWPTYSVNTLFFNTQKYPFDNPIFRRAISIAINKKQLEKEVYFGTGGYNPNQAGLIPSQYDWMDPSLEATNNYLNTYNPKAAQDLLSSIGFVKNSSGNLVGPNGKVLPTFSIDVTNGWTDFLTMAQIISANLKEIGLNTRVNSTEFGNYMASLSDGDFSILLNPGLGYPPGPTPYFQYYSSFNPAFYAKTGESAISDYTRFIDSTVTAALNNYAQTSNLETQKQDMYQIEKIFLEEIPYIPLTNRTQFNIYNESTITGFPSNEYPYSGGNTTSDQIGIGSTDFLVTVLNVHLK